MSYPIVSHYSSEPPKSDLLKKYIERSNLNAAYNLQSPPDEVVKPKKQTKKTKIAAIALGSVVFVTLGTIWGASGAGRKTFEKTNKFISNKTKKGAEALLKNTDAKKANEILQKIYSADSGANIANAFENFTNIKDVLTRKFFKKLENVTHGKINFYQKLDDASTAFYKKKGLQTLNKKYQNALNLFNMSDKKILLVLDELEKSPRAQQNILHNGKQTKIADIIPEIREKISQRQQHLTEAFSSDKITQRYNDFDSYLTQDGANITDKTTERFIDKLKNKKIKDILMRPIAGTIIKGKKYEHTKNLEALRSKVTNSLNNVLDENKNLVSSLQKSISPDDIKSLKMLDETVNLFEFYSKAPFESIEDSRKAHNVIMRQLEELKKCISPSDTKKAAKKIEYLQNKIGKAQYGDTEELMGLLKEVLEPETYIKNIKPGITNSIHALNRACTAECTNMIDKLRDINCGSAPTDILGVLFSTGALGLYTAMAENKDERVSVGLTTGVPIISTIGTSLFGTINQIGGKKLAFLSGTVGLITKIACDAMNKSYRKHKGLNENEKPSVVTIDDYIEPYKNKVEELFTD